MFTIWRSGRLHKRTHPHKRKLYQHRWTMHLFVVAAWVSVLAGAASAQTAANTILITGIDSSSFPDVQLTIRAFDTTNVLISTLNSSDLTVVENGQPVNDVVISQGDSIPNYVYFMVDRNQYNTFDQFSDSVLRDMFAALINDGHLTDGVDTIGLIATDPNALNDITVVVPPTNSAETFLNTLPTLSYEATNRANTLDGISYALNEMNAMVEPGQGNISVIYVGAAFDGAVQSALISGAESLASRFNEVGATFHALHTADLLPEPIQTLVNGTGGQYISFSPSQDNRAAVQTLYQTLVAQAAALRVEYRSTLSDSGDRTVTIVPAGAAWADAPAAASATYTVNLTTPTISISEPSANQVFTREGVPNNSGGYDYTLQTINVKAQLDWQDGVPRKIVRAELVSNGVVVSELQNPASQTFDFLIDVNDIMQSTTLPIAVQVVDELGGQAISEQRQLRVEVSQLSEAILTPQVTVVVTETTIETEVVKTPCEENPRSMQCISTSYLPWLIGIGSLLGLVIVTISFRRQLAGLSQNAGNVVSNAVEQVRKTMLGGSGRGQKVIAKMKVLTARPDLVNQEIDIYTHTTSFGRDPKLCDVQLYDHDDRSTVSGLHCTLQYEVSKDVFYLTDDNSSAGTRINGKRIATNDPIVLHDGDEITLGDLFRRGAKLQFLVASVAASNAAVAKYGEDDEDAFAPYESNNTPPAYDYNVVPEPSANVTMFDDFVDATPADNVGFANDPGFADDFDSDAGADEVDETYGRTVLDHGAMMDEPNHNATILDNSADDFDFDFTDDEGEAEDDDWLSQLD